MKISPHAATALLLDTFPYQPTEGQRELIEKLGGFISGGPSHRLFLLKGYAGTGKTTVIAQLVSVLHEAGLQSVLLAPTGRAAKVMSNYSGKTASTIHRKIYRAAQADDGRYVTMLRENNYRDTLFIVDEASMIAGENRGSDEVFGHSNLLDDLIHFVYSGNNCILLLCGDTAQLPPVGVSLSPALDEKYLTAAYHLDIQTSELTGVVRQAEDSGILQAATYLRLLIQKKKIPRSLFPPLRNADVIRAGGSELEEALSSSGPGSGDNDSVVICRSNKRAYLFNREIRNRVLFREGEIAAGDLLMVVKNNYHWLPGNQGGGFIANGDMLEVMRIKNETELFGFRFADASIRLTDEPGVPVLEVKLLLDTLSYEGPSLPLSASRKLFDEIKKDYEHIAGRRDRIKSIFNDPWLNALQVKHAYALTCHKTQGGQWKHVFVEQGYLTDDMINRDYLRWLYTAVTRASDKLWLVNFNDKFFG